MFSFKNLHAGKNVSFEFVPLLVVKMTKMEDSLVNSLKTESGVEQ